MSSLADYFPSADLISCKDFCIFLFSSCNIYIPYKLDKPTPDKKAPHLCKKEEPPLDTEEPGVEEEEEEENWYDFGLCDNLIQDDIFEGSRALDAILHMFLLD